MAGMGRTGRDRMDGAAGLNCAACRNAAEETDHRGGALLRCMRPGLRGICGRVVSRYPEGYRHVEECEPPVWCEKTKGEEK